VNGAPRLQEVDWLVAYDSSEWCRPPKPLQIFSPFARVGVMSRESRRYHPRAPGLRFLANAEVIPKALWQEAAGFSMPGAMCLCVYLGATEVVTFGDDKSGTRYFDGTECGEASPGRWVVEGRMCDAIVSHFPGVHFGWARLSGGSTRVSG
jgi:hypothetical protein